MQNFAESKNVKPGLFLFISTSQGAVLFRNTEPKFLQGSFKALMVVWVMLSSLYYCENVRRFSCVVGHV